MQVTARESVWVELGGVKFAVTFNENDKPLAIKERRMHAPGTFYSAWHNAPRWHHSHGPLSPRSKLYSVLEEARKKLHDRRHAGS